ncbi:MAG: 6-phosphofructokinase [Clostridiales Family XIII bacterium]|jgi:6-phosphofructokinase 1|nr:6-phosphofructokinase [Clostridiales Family XIII bacterium]
MKRIGVLTSGGDAPGMNAAIRAIVRTAIYMDMEIFGIERGFNGLIDGDISQMNRRDVGDIVHRGGTILKTARSESFLTDQGFARAINILESFRIEGLIVIGGNGSLSGALKLAKAGVKVIGIPGTIDNDLGYTDYTIGFDTAVNTALSAIGNIRDTSHSHDRTTIVEVMGRHCGDIAICTAIGGGAEIALIPEQPFDIDEVCRKLIEAKHRGKMSSIIIKAEGANIASQTLADLIIERTGVDAKVVILGYIQRGGSPTVRDRILASTLGFEAVKLLKNDIFNRAVGVTGDQVIHLELEEALAVEKDRLIALADLVDVFSI